jgi:hypothetical protein
VILGKATGKTEAATVLRDSGEPGKSQRHQTLAVNLSAAVARWLRIMARHLGRLSEMFFKLGILAGSEASVRWWHGDRSAEMAVRCLSSRRRLSTVTSSPQRLPGQLPSST